MRFPIYVLILSFILLQACTETRPEPGPVTPNDSVVSDSDERDRLDKGPGIDELDAEIIYAQAQDLKYLGKREEALYKMKYLLKQEVKDKYLYLNILQDYLEWAQELQETGQTRKISSILKEAKDIGDEGYRLYPDFLEMLYQYGEILRMTQHDRDMMSLLEHILRISDTDTYANYYLANYYYQSNDKSKAKYYFHKVAAYANSSSMLGLNSLFSAYYHLGQMAIDDGYFNVAISYLEKARAYYSQGFEIDQLLALVYGYTIDYRRSAEYFKQIPQAYMTTELAESYAGILFFMKDPSLNDLIMEYKDSSSLLRAMEYYYLGEYQKSLKSLGSYRLQKHQSPFYVYELYSLLYQHLGDRQKSLQYRFLMSNLSRYYKKNDLSISLLKELENEKYLKKEVSWLIAQLYENKEDFESARDYYELFLELSHSDEDRLAAELQIAGVLFKEHKIQESREFLDVLEKKYEKKALKMEVASFSGLLKMETNDYTNALRDFQRAYMYDNNNSRIYYLLGSLYARQLDYTQAIAVLENALNFYPGDPNLQNLLAYMYAEKGIKLDKAFTLINQALLGDPRNLAYLDTKAWILFRQGKQKKSLDLFHTIAGMLYYYEEQDGIDEIYLHMAIVYESMSDKVKTLEYLELGRAVNPQNVQINEMLEKMKKN